MLKTDAKRRRPPAEIKAERESKDHDEFALKQKLEKLKAFELHIDRKKAELKNSLNAGAILSDLIKTGAVKQYEGGQWGAVLPGDPGIAEDA